MGLQPGETRPLRVIAYTGYAWESSLALLRIVGPAQYSGIELIRGVESNQIYPERVSSADLVVVQREFPRHVREFRQIAERARLERKPLILDLDDLLLELPEDHPDRLSHHYADALFPLAQAILEADAIIASSALLRDYLLYFNSAACLLPNYLNEHLWVLRDPPEQVPDRFPVVIGYMGGDSHAPDVHMIAPVLARILQKYPGQVCLRMYGLKPEESLAGLPGVEWVSVTEYNYARFAAYFCAEECDIFIAPLQDNSFNRCKSSIKFLEYSATATPGVYSRLPPYETMVVHGENGFLASDLSEWEEGLERLIESPSLRVEMGCRAQDTVKQKWLLSEHAGEWAETYQRILSHQHDPRGDRPLQASDLADRLFRLADQVREAHAAQLDEKEKTLQILVEKQVKTEQELSRVYKTLNDIEGTRAWKTAQHIQRLRLALFPMGSYRARLGRKALDILRMLGRLLGRANGS